MIATRRGIKIRHFVVILLLFWTGLAAASLWWNMVDIKERILETARIQANLTLEKDLIYRRWVASHGGVYVPVSERTPPSHYLNVLDRDVKTSAGQILTLMDHAYMTRQVNEMAAETGAYYGRLTSLFSYSPGNNPDSWEKTALEAFGRGEKEVYEIAKISGKDHLRLMRPFVIEKSCLPCHVWQGYKVGDISGGISVAIDMKPFYALQEKDTIRLSAIHGIVWLVFAGLIVFGGKRLKAAQESLTISEHRFRVPRKRWNRYRRRTWSGGPFCRFSRLSRNSDCSRCCGTSGRTVFPGIIRSATTRTVASKDGEKIISTSFLPEKSLPSTTMSRKTKKWRRRSGCMR
jgi:hypothetical protein